MNKTIVLACLALACAPEAGALSSEEFSRQVLAPYENALTDPPVPGAKIAEWSAFERKIWLGMKKMAGQIEARYMAGAWSEEDSSSLMAWCYGHREACRKVSYALRPVFITTIVDTLSRAKSPVIARLLKEPRALNRVKLVVGGGLDGGFHRGKGFAFLDILGIAPNELSIVYVHEMFHSLDPKLKEASAFYLGGGEMYRFFQASPKLESEKAMPAENLAYLKAWLQAGLDRGLLAEWRAWVPTLRVYLEGRKDGLWERVPRLEAILAEKRAGESLERLTFRYLDAHFTDPEKKVFSVPVVRSVLKTIRQELRSGERRLETAGLDAIVPFAWP